MLFQKKEEIKKDSTSLNLELTKLELINILSVLKNRWVNIVEFNKQHFLIFDIKRSAHVKGTELSDIKYDFCLKVPLHHEFDLNGLNVLKPEFQDGKGQKKTAKIDFENAILVVVESTAPLFSIHKKIVGVPKEDEDFEGVFDTIKFNAGTVEYLKERYTDRYDRPQFEKFINEVKVNEVVKRQHKWIQSYRKKVDKYFIV
ncbi:hypothetical protein M1K46_20890 [Fictibacillus sp. WQ 8-8]|uniref:hypothetical protein n=1 Tax=unclassified Fictibacillus TaxID=2644029 RepID=UPI000781CC43|nr:MULTISPECIES: hypothetical protein [unclassified Fictibacillus]MCQ6268080.1 hypothetical protein [Fictibacillus sp. WQ 8-8]SFE93275.1 hypothetical protein SAMN05428981_110105 [Bacillus sp. OV194]